MVTYYASARIDTLKALQHASLWWCKAGQFICLISSCGHCADTTAWTPRRQTQLSIPGRRRLNDLAGAVCVTQNYDRHTQKEDFLQNMACSQRAQKGAAIALRPLRTCTGTEMTNDQAQLHAV